MLCVDRFQLGLDIGRSPLDCDTVASICVLSRLHHPKALLLGLCRSVLHELPKLFVIGAVDMKRYWNSLERVNTL